MECFFTGPHQWGDLSSENVGETQVVQNESPNLEFAGQVQLHGGKLPLASEGEIQGFGDVENDQRHVHCLPTSNPNCTATPCNLLELMYPEPTPHNYRIRVSSIRLRVLFHACGRERNHFNESECQHADVFSGCEPVVEENAVT